MKLETTPEARMQMLLRVPVSDAFEAIVDPDITSKFWFSESDGRLEAGKSVNWYWKDFELTMPVKVLELVSSRRLLIEWSSRDDVSKVE